MKKLKSKRRSIKITRTNGAKIHILHPCLKWKILLQL